MKLFVPNIWLDIRGMGGVGLISPLEFLQLKLVISFLDLLVQSAQIFQLLYPSIRFHIDILAFGQLDLLSHSQTAMLQCLAVQLK